MRWGGEGEGAVGAAVGAGVAVTGWSGWEVAKGWAA